MKFGPVPPREAKGATAAHSVRAGERVVRKGTIIGDAEIATLERAGIKEIVAARLEPGDVSEDEAAASLAQAVAGEGVRRDATGRANSMQSSGVLVDRAGVSAQMYRRSVVATLPAFKPVRAGEMIATKIFLH
jgi:molybdenum cofactor cytidylyltransferase